MSDDKLNLDGKRQDGIETIEGGLENYLIDQQETADKEQEETPALDFTVEEKRKILRQMGTKPRDITDEEIEVLTEKEIEEIKEFAKQKEKKSIFAFVNRKKNVTDDDVKDLTEDDMKEMMATALIMSQHLTYNPKKTYNTAYKKKRQNKNKMARQSRRANR